MKITTVKVGLSYTYNLGDYSNVRPTAEMTVELEDGDILADVLDNLEGIVAKQVHDEIDKALEAAGRPPAFYQGPRFKLLATSEARMAAIVPDKVRDFPGVWDNLMPQCYERPFTTVLEYARKQYPDYQLYDCSDGDFSKLPPLEKYTIVTLFGKDGKMLYVIVGDKEFSRRQLDEGWRWNARENVVISLLGNMIAEMQEKAAKNGAEFIDVTSGGIIKLPPGPGPDEDQIPF